MDFIEKLYHNDISGTDIGELRLFLCGKRTDAPNHRFGPAARDNFWLIYLRDGAGVLEVGRHSCRIGKGDIFVVYPNRRTYYRADNGSVWTLYWLSLAAPIIEEVLPLLGISEDSPVKSVDDRVSIEETFELLLEQFELETPEAKLRCQSLVYKLLSFLTVSGQTAKPRDYIDEAIRQAVLSLEEGEVSQPVLTVNGYHIVRRDSVLKGGAISLESVKEKLTQQLTAQREEDAWENSVEEWIKQAQVERFDDIYSLDT